MDGRPPGNTGCCRLFASRFALSLSRPPPPPPPPGTAAGPTYLRPLPPERARGGALRLPGRPGGQKAALEGSRIPAAPGVAGLDPDSASGPGAGRPAREPLDLHLAAPTSAQPRRSHLSAGVSLHSSLRKSTPPLRRFASAGGGSGGAGRDRFPGPAGHQGRGPVLGGRRGGKGGLAGAKGPCPLSGGSQWLRASCCPAGGPARPWLGCA